jgi:hypothetical protein
LPYVASSVTTKAQCKTRQTSKMRSSTDNKNK